MFQLIRETNQYSVCHSDQHGLIVQRKRDDRGALLGPNHPQYRDYLVSLRDTDCDAYEVNNLCRSLLS